MGGKIHRNSLKPGHKILWYEIKEILGQGGFGITYLAHDTNLEEDVAIKEYLPIEMAVREGDFSVHPVSEDHDKNYHWGLERFITEARTLTKFKHPNIVRVRNVFEDNNTAYIVMEYEKGKSLQDKLAGRKTLEEPELLKILIPILGGLEIVHRKGFIHRDIKPDNIFIRNDGSPVLLDFGSARYALGEQTKTLTSLVTPGYAPFEQYFSKSDGQGRWTDIYGMGATLYRAISGIAPVNAVDRSQAIHKTSKDTLVSAMEIGKGKYSPEFLQAVDRALAFLPQDRLQNVAEWRSILDFKDENESGSSTRNQIDPNEAPTIVAPSDLPVQRPDKVIRLSGHRLKAGISRWLISVASIGAVAVVVWYLWDFSEQTGEQPVPVPAVIISEDSDSSSSADPLPAQPDSRQSQVMVRTDEIQDSKVIQDKQILTPVTVFRDSLKDGSKGPAMVVISPGEFRMGDLQGTGLSREMPVHTVNIGQAMVIGQNEITFAEYDHFAVATGYAKPDDAGWGRDNRPVINVSKDDAVTYAQWLSEQTGKIYRLPSEGEWEYANRAGSETNYWWGDASSYDNANYGKESCCDGISKGQDRWIYTAPIGSFKANDFGLYDTAGNVWEWVEDCWHSSYRGAPTDGSAWVSVTCSRGTIRGGSWRNGPKDLRSSSRFWLDHNLRNNFLGFRLVREIN